jgi:hypothetical protein
MDTRAAGQARSTIQITVRTPPAWNTADIVLVPWHFPTHCVVAIAACSTIPAEVGTMLGLAVDACMTAADTGRTVLITTTAPVSGHAPTIVAESVIAVTAICTVSTVLITDISPFPCHTAAIAPSLRLLTPIDTAIAASLIAVIAPPTSDATTST